MSALTAEQVQAIEQAKARRIEQCEEEIRELRGAVSPLDTWRILGIPLIMPRGNWPLLPHMAGNEAKGQFRFVSESGDVLERRYPGHPNGLGWECIVSNVKEDEE